MQIVNMQASMQESAHQHKQVVEEVDRLRIELKRISDDCDLRASQVWEYQTVCNLVLEHLISFNTENLFSCLKTPHATQQLVGTFEKVVEALKSNIFRPAKCLN